MSDVILTGVSRVFGDYVAVQGLTLTIRDGSVVSLLGASGCGKTTTLRMIAGLERPDSGTVVIGDRVVSSVEDNVWVSPERRGIGMVFQSYALWPHMSVFSNVAYPLKMLRGDKRISKAEIMSRVSGVLDKVGLAEYAERSPGELSGGQQQRVAVARALARKPDVLLMDEPFSNLDTRLRERMVVELRELHREVGITTIYVTHDQSEAAILSDEVVIMHQGKVVESGPPTQVYSGPATLQGADFLGYNTQFKGTVSRVTPEADERLRVDVKGDGWLAAGLGDRVAVGDRVALVLRPATLRVESGNGTGGGLNCWEGRVLSTYFTGDGWRAGVDVLGFRLTVRLDDDQSIPKVGGLVRVSTSKNPWIVRS